MRTIRPLALGLAILTISACNGVTTAVSASPTNTPEPKFNSAAPGEAPATADILFINGSIITMDEANPQASDLAVLGDKILGVGTSEEMAKYRGAGTIVVDLKGRTLVPGFIDSHQYRIQKRTTVGIDDAGAIIQTAIQQGWTSLDELYVDQGLMNELLDLDQAGTLRLRVNAYLPFMQYDAAGTKLGDWYQAYHQGQVLSPHVRVAGLIGFADFDNATVLLWQQNDLNAFLLKAQQQGWTVALKTVSTRSLEMILDAYAYVETADPQAVNSRNRLEHTLFITPDQISRIKQLGLIPVINLNNPGQLVGEPDVDALIAREPQGTYAPWRSLEQAGILVANGSAWPSYYVDEPTGAPFGSPMHLMYQGITRTGNLGRKPYPWLLDQTITAQEALPRPHDQFRLRQLPGGYYGKSSAWKTGGHGHTLRQSTERCRRTGQRHSGIDDNDWRESRILRSGIQRPVFPRPPPRYLHPRRRRPIPLPLPPFRCQAALRRTQSTEILTPCGARARAPSNGSRSTWASPRTSAPFNSSSHNTPQVKPSTRSGAARTRQPGPAPRIRGVSPLTRTSWNSSRPHLKDIRYVRIVTTQSPSWVAWREIEIVRSPGG